VREWEPQKGGQSLTNCWGEESDSLSGEGKSGKVQTLLFLRFESWISEGKTGGRKKKVRRGVVLLEKTAPDRGKTRKKKRKGGKFCYRVIKRKRKGKKAVDLGKSISSLEEWEVLE